MSNVGAYIRVSLSAAAFLALAAAPAAAQEIECAAPASATEEAICADPSLYALDQERLGLAGALSASDSSVWESEKAWLGTRDACGGDAGCLANAYGAHNAALRVSLEALTAAPADEEPTAAPDTGNEEAAPAPRSERRTTRPSRRTRADSSDGAPLDMLGVAIFAGLAVAGGVYLLFATFIAGLTWRDFEYRTFANPTTLLSFVGLLLFIAGAQLVGMSFNFAGVFGLAAFACWILALLRNVRGTNVLFGLVVTFLQVTAVVLAPFALVTMRRA
ncbi:hypothetical protein [Terricaulis sp.]|uniref:hypothetical protein n=1 Tax=Terricaulis sp. TaxID=2768686 RepID=UPI003782DD59